MKEIESSCAALAEARRCFQCDTPTCTAGCPLRTDIRGFISHLAKGNFGLAYEALGTSNLLPAICGKLCAKEKQCEARCKMAAYSDPINISGLEYFVANFAYEHELTLAGKSAPPCGRVAIIGSGIAGLAVAEALARHNYAVTIYEAQREPGGVLLYGVPEVRLHKEAILKEIANLTNYGVEICTNTPVGKDFALLDLFTAGFDAIFVGTGSPLAKTLDLPGKELAGVAAANYFLRMVFLSDEGKCDDKEAIINPGDEVVVVGAGNVAIDAARTAVRRGAGLVTVVYHKAPANMSCDSANYIAAVREGVQFKFLRQPVAYLNGRQIAALGAQRRAKVKLEAKALAGIVLQEVVTDANGSFTNGTNKEIIPCSVVLLAIGQRPAAQIFDSVPGIEFNEQGYLVMADKPYGMTTRPGIFSGGDTVNGPSTIVLTVAECQKVAQGIMEYITEKKAHKS